MSDEKKVKFMDQVKKFWEATKAWSSKNKNIMRALFLALFIAAFVGAYIYMNPNGLNVGWLITIGAIAAAVWFWLVDPFKFGKFKAFGLGLLSSLFFVFFVSGSIQTPYYGLAQTTADDVTSGVNFQPSGGANGVPNLEGLKQLAHKFNIKGTADLDKAFNVGAIDANMYLLLGQLYANDQVLAKEVVRIQETSDSNNLVFGGAIVNNYQAARESSPRANSSDELADLKKQLAELRNAKNQPDNATSGKNDLSFGQAGNGNAAQPVKEASQGWKDWRNKIDVTLYLDANGRFWKPGASETTAKHLAINPGEGITGISLEQGDYGPPLMDAQGNYYDIDGPVEHNGVWRDGWAISPDGQLHQGWFIREGESLSVDLSKKPVDVHKPARWLVPSDGSKIIRLRNYGE